jgi:hypothetical protein
VTAAKINLVNVPLIYRENLAGLRATGAIDKTSSLLGQHGTGEEQVTAGAALPTIAFADKKLVLNKFLSEMNQPQTPDLACGVKHKAGILKYLCKSENQTIEKSAQSSDLAKPSVHTMANRLHIRSC